VSQHQVLHIRDRQRPVQKRIALKINLADREVNKLTPDPLDKHGCLLARAN